MWADYQRPELPDPPDAGSGGEEHAESDVANHAIMAPIFAPTPRPTPSPTVSPGNPTSACARTARPVVATPPVALAATEIAGRLVVVVGPPTHHDDGLGQHHRDDLRCGCCLDRRRVSRGAPERQDPGAGPRVLRRVGPRRRRDRQGLAHCFYCLMLLRRPLASEAARSLNLVRCIFAHFRA